MPSAPNPSRDAAGPSSPKPGLLGRVLVTLFFIGLLLTPSLVRRLSSTSAGGPGDVAVDRAEALDRYGFVLDEVSADVGIDFRHAPPILDSLLEPVMPLVASVGASVSVADFDRDGWPDLYVTSSAAGTPNALYRNRGDGTFDDVAGELGVADLNRPGTGASMGTVWGDYDNDGFEDLFVIRWGRSTLFHNDAGRGFTPVAGAELGGWMNANTAVWLDYDRDGLLDLFVGGYFPGDLDLWHLEDTRIMPESFEYARNGGENRLYRNLGDGTFRDVAAELGLTGTRWTLAATAADVNADGWIDLFVANDFGINELYLNDEGRGFREVGRDAELSHTPKSGMNASAGDVLNRGEWNLFVSNIAEPGVLLHGNDLWTPTGDDAGVPRYSNLAVTAGVEAAGWSYAAQFADLNNDGWLDLYQTNGFHSGERRDSYWYDYSKVTGGNRSIIQDTKNWPALEGRSLSGYQRDRVWLNRGAGRFYDVAGAVGVRGTRDERGTRDGRGVAVADLWNRGVLDVIVANQAGPLLVYRNTVAPDRHWIAFDLRGAANAAAGRRAAGGGHAMNGGRAANGGRESAAPGNRSAIGAEVRLFVDGRVQVQQVSGGSGFAAQNDRRVHFGLGDQPSAAPAVDSVVIRWPSGARRTLVAPAAGTLHVVVEGAS